MEPLIDIGRIPNLTKAQKRDFSMLIPYMQNGNWVTSITLAKAMYQISDLSKKEISKVSTILSKLYHNTDLLERKQRRKIYFQHITKNPTTFAYRIDPKLIESAVIAKMFEQVKPKVDPTKPKVRIMGASGFQANEVLKHIQLTMFP